MANSEAGQKNYGDVNPALADYTDRVLFDQVWSDPTLSPRDRSVVTVSALVAGYRINELPSHLKLALKNGVTADELKALVTHLAFYAGWPAASTATGILRQVLQDAEQ